MKKRLDSNTPGPSGNGMSRRKFVATTGLVAASGILAGRALASAPGKSEMEPSIPPPLPWPWVKIDPEEAGRRAFKNYHDKGG